MNIRILLLLSAFGISLSSTTLLAMEKNNNNNDNKKRSHSKSPNRSNKKTKQKRLFEDHVTHLRDQLLHLINNRNTSNNIEQLIPQQGVNQAPTPEELVEAIKPLLEQAQAIATFLVQKKCIRQSPLNNVVCTIKTVQQVIQTLTTALDTMIRMITITKDQTLNEHNQTLKNIKSSITQLTAEPIITVPVLEEVELQNTIEQEIESLKKELITFIKESILSQKDAALFMINCLQPCTHALLKSDSSELTQKVTFEFFVPVLAETIIKIFKCEAYDNVPTNELMVVCQLAQDLKIIEISDLATHMISLLKVCCAFKTLQTTVDSDHTQSLEIQELITLIPVDLISPIQECCSIQNSPLLTALMTITGNTIYKTIECINQEKNKSKIGLIWMNDESGKEQFIIFASSINEFAKLLNCPITVEESAQNIEMIETTNEEAEQMHQEILNLENLKEALNRLTQQLGETHENYFIFISSAIDLQSNINTINWSHITQLQSLGLKNIRELIDLIVVNLQENNNQDSALHNLKKQLEQIHAVFVRVSPIRLSLNSISNNNSNNNNKPNINNNQEIPTNLEATKIKLTTLIDSLNLLKDTLIGDEQTIFDSLITSIAQHLQNISENEAFLLNTMETSLDQLIEMSSNIVIALFNQQELRTTQYETLKTNLDMLYHILS